MQAEQQSERDLFEAELKGLDFTKSADGWGRETYHHPHVQSIWYGWQARAALSHPSTPQGWKPSASESAALSALIGPGAAYQVIDFLKTPTSSLRGAWKLVPAEPTPEMCAVALIDEGARITDGPAFASDLYRAMLAVSPPTPEQGSKG